MIRVEAVTTPFVDPTVDRFRQLSTECFACFWETEFLCAWGLIPPSLMADEAYLWLHHVPAFSEHKTAVIRESRRYIDFVTRTLYHRIIGHCLCDNLPAQRWVAWLGGRFGEGDPIPFIIERSDG